MSIQLILSQAPEIFLINPRTDAIQRGLTFLCFPTTTAGSVCIDNQYGRGTSFGVEMFRNEIQQRDGWREVMCSHIASRLAEFDIKNPGAIGKNAAILDRIQAKDMMARQEHFNTYFTSIKAACDADGSGIDPVLLTAISYIESAGVPRLRFEKHIYKRYHRVADLKARRFNSCSFGIFQLMGFNLVRQGKPVDYLADQANTTRQTMTILKFIRNDRRLYRGFLAADYAKIAYSYNGQNYKQNNYDSKLKWNHAKFRELFAQSQREA